MIDEKIIKKILPRLKKIEGQIKGVAQMIEKKEYCIDILQQIFAIRGGLKSIILIILENHINTCVKDAIASENDEEIREKIEELVNIYKKFSK